jgi:hypothetical protein
MPPSFLRVALAFMPASSPNSSLRLCVIRTLFLYGDQSLDRPPLYARSIFPDSAPVKNIRDPPSPYLGPAETLTALIVNSSGIRE